MTPAARLPLSENHRSRRRLMAHNNFEPNVTRRIAVGIAALVALLGLAGCGARPQDCSRPGVRCAGLVTDFGSVDEGIPHEAWLALQDALDSGPA